MWEPRKRLTTILMESLCLGLHEPRPNVVQVLERRTSDDSLGLMQYGVLGKIVLSSQLGGDGGNWLTVC